MERKQCVQLDVWNRGGNKPESLTILPANKAFSVRVGQLGSAVKDAAKQSLVGGGPGLKSGRVSSLFPPNLIYRQGMMVDCPDFFNASKADSFLLDALRQENMRLLGPGSGGEGKKGGDEEEEKKDKAVSAAETKEQKPKPKRRLAPKEFTAEHRQETIHIFSLASGAMYERLLGIMMATVRMTTKNPLKFYFLKEFLYFPQNPRIKNGSLFWRCLSTFQVFLPPHRVWVVCFVLVHIELHQERWGNGCMQDSMYNTNW